MLQSRIELTVSSDRHVRIICIKILSFHKTAQAIHRNVGLYAIWVSEISWIDRKLSEVSPVLRQKFCNGTFRTVEDRSPCTAFRLNVLIVKWFYSAVYAFILRTSARGVMDICFYIRRFMQGSDLYRMNWHLFPVRDVWKTSNRKEKWRTVLNV